MAKLIDIRDCELQDRIESILHRLLIDSVHHKRCYLDSLVRFFDVLKTSTQVSECEKFVTFPLSAPIEMKKGQQVYEYICFLLVYRYDYSLVFAELPYLRNLVDEYLDKLSEPYNYVYEPITDFAFFDENLSEKNNSYPF